MSVEEILQKRERINYERYTNKVFVVIVILIIPILVNNLIFTLVYIPTVFIFSFYYMKQMIACVPEILNEVLEM